MARKPRRRKSRAGRDAKGRIKSRALAVRLGKKGHRASCKRHL